MDADSKIKCPVRINYGPVRINHGPVRIGIVVLLGIGSILLGPPLIPLILHCKKRSYHAGELGSMLVNLRYCQGWGAG